MVLKRCHRLPIMITVFNLSNNTYMVLVLCLSEISLTLIPRNQLQVYEKYAGNPYYSDPVYKESGILQTKSDLYTFGVLLFEMLSGILAYDDENTDDDESFDDDTVPNLMNLVRRYYDDELSMLVDPFIRDQVTSQTLLAFTQLAYECVDFNIKAPPSTNRIVKRLEAILLDAESNGATSSATIIRSHDNQKLEDFLIPIEDIRKATKNFSKDTCVGNGGYGTVYRGQLQNLTAAVKRIDRRPHLGKNEFLNELELIFTFHHENIIRFIGYCDQDNEKIIVTEYAENGSLDDYLDKQEKRCRLTWEKRLQICLGAAKGFEYLHSAGVIHTDIKSGNILLDENLEANICDFGLSISHPTNQTDTGVLNQDAGTKYYKDPVLGESNKLRTESDVYSFGVVMFEMLRGQLAYKKGRFGDDKHARYLIDLVRHHYASGVDILMDPLIRDRTDNISFLTFQDLAYRCINMEYKERPTMANIIDTIEEALGYQERYLQRQQLQGLSIGSSSKGNGQQDKK